MQSENLSLASEQPGRTRCYFEMLQENALKIAKPFLEEECCIVTKLIKQYPINAFLGIGCGSGLYSNTISNHCQYMGIDPLYQRGKEKLNIIVNQFEVVTIKRRKQRFVISFLFNLISYINFPSVINFLNRNSKPGDIITISTWNTNVEAKFLRNKYLQYIFSKSDSEYSRLLENFSDLETLLCNQVNNYKKHELIKYKYSKTLIVYL